MKLFCILMMLCSVSQGSYSTVSQKNFEGQKYLFDNGWHVIPSGSKAWDYFRTNSLETSSEAMSHAVSDLRKSKYKMKEFSAYINSAKAVNHTFSEGATSSEKKLSELAAKLDASGIKSGKKLSKESYDRFVIGYTHYEERTVEERKRLKNFFKNYITDYNSSVKRLDDGFSTMEQRFFSEMQVEWKKSFGKAGDVFASQYEKSGTRGNSLSGLWDVVVGHAKALYYAVLRPSVEESKYVVQKSLFYITKGVFHTVFISGSVVYSTGANLYASGKMGYKIISPTIEGGLLASLSVITLVASQTGKYVLRGSGVISKYALEGAGKVAATGQFVAHTAYDGTKDAAYSIVRLGSGASEVIVETSYGAVVLGYTALAQLTTQTLLGAVNSTVFLIYDGPKLIIAKISGDEFKGMPAGTVLDKKKIEDAGHKIEQLDVDDKTMQKILKEMK